MTTFLSFSCFSIFDSVIFLRPDLFWRIAIFGFVTFFALVNELILPRESTSSPSSLLSTTEVTSLLASLSTIFSASTEFNKVSRDDGEIPYNLIDGKLFCTSNELRTELKVSAFSFSLHAARSKQTKDFDTIFSILISSLRTWLLVKLFMTTCA